MRKLLRLLLGLGFAVALIPFGNPSTAGATATETVTVNWSVTSSGSSRYQWFTVPDNRIALRAYASLSTSSCSDDGAVYYKRLDNGSTVLGYGGNNQCDWSRWIDFSGGAREIQLFVDDDKGSSDTIRITKLELKVEKPLISLSDGPGLTPYQVQVQWQFGSSQGATYELWRETYRGGSRLEEKLLYSGADTGFTTTDQSAADAYYIYQVKAVAGGEEVWSDPAAFFAAPRPTVTVLESARLRVDWTAPHVSAQYRVKYRAEGGSWQDAGVAAKGATSYTIGPLDANYPYTIALEPALPNGGPAYTAEAEGSSYPIWGAPGAISFTGIDQTALTVNWSNGSLPTSGVRYRLLRNDEQIYEGAGRTHADVGRAPGVEYTYSVCAVNGQGVCGPAVTAVVTTVPATPAAPTGVVGGLGWSTVGRGYVTMSWQPVQGAAGYGVWVSDGYQHRRFDVGSATSWDSRIAKIYPSESWLNSRSNDSITSDPFNHSGAGENLRDDPNPLYQKTKGDTYDSEHSYWFRVSAYNRWGESPYSEAWQPILPDQTDVAAPVGVTVRINGGATQTGGSRVQVAVTAQDDESGLTDVQLSNDGSNWTTVGQMSGSSDDRTFTWMLNATSFGTKTVHARVRDVVGHWSARVSAQILYMLTDVTGARVTLRINGRATTADSRTVSLSIQATDDQTPQAGMRMRFSNDGVSWSAWEPFQPAKTWTLSAGEGRKTVWAEVQDGAGNAGSNYAEILYRASPDPGADSEIFWSGTGSQGQYDTGAGSIPVQFVRVHEVVLHWGAVSGAAMVRYGFDNTAFVGRWENLTPNRTVKLPARQGMQTLYAQLDDGRVFAIRFLVDTEAPEVAAAWQGGATVTGSGGAAVVSLRVQDNLARAEDLQVSVHGGPWASYQPQIPVTLAGTGTQTVTVAVRDPAGNAVVTVLDIYVLP